EGRRMQARAGIPYGDPYRLPVFRERPNQQLAWTIARTAHGLDGVDDQIEDDLLQLDAIRQDAWRLTPIIGEANLQPDIAALHFAARQGHDLAYRLVDVDPVLLRRRFRREGADAADDLPRSMTLRGDTRDRLPRFLQLLRGEPAQARTGVIDDGSQRLVDLMGNRRGHLPQHGDPRRMGQVRLRLPQRLLGLLARGDVHDRADVLEGARFIFHGMGQDVDGLDRPIGQEQAMLEIEI